MPDINQIPNMIVHGVSDPQLPVPQTGFGENVSDSFAGGLQGTSLGLASRLLGPTGATPLSEDDFNNNPFYKDSGVSYKAGMTTEEADMVAKAHEDAQYHSDIYSRATTAGTLGSWGSSFAGGMLDPVNLIPFGAGAKVGSSFVKAAITAGLTNAALSASVYSPLEYAVSQQEQFDYGAGDVVKQAALAALIGAVAGGIGHALSERGKPSIPELTAALHEEPRGESAPITPTTFTPDHDANAETVQRISRDLGITPEQVIDHANANDETVRRLQADLDAGTKTPEQVRSEANAETVRRLQADLEGGLSPEQANAETVRRLQEDLGAEPSRIEPNERPQFNPEVTKQVEKDGISAALASEQAVRARGGDINEAADALHGIDKITNPADVSSLLKEHGFDAIKDTSEGTAIQTEITKLQDKRNAIVKAFYCLIGGS